MVGFISRNSVESCLRGDKKERWGERGGVDGMKEKLTSELPNADVVSVYIQTATNAPLHCRVSTQVQKECFVVPVTLTTQSRQS